jgi:hypothetical protein
MKKFTTSIAALLVFTAASFAAGSSKTTASAENKVAANAATTASYSLSQLIEENSMLKMQLETMVAESEDTKSKLDYTGMMHTTISNLQKQETSIAEDNAKSQLDYAKMMTATLVNLAKVAGN